MVNTFYKLVILFVLIVVSIIATDFASKNSDTLSGLFEFLRDALKKVLVFYIPFSAIVMTLVFIADAISKITNILNGSF